MDEMNIEKVLQAEQWTRTQIGAYTLPQFQQLDDMLAKLDEDGKTEAKDYCEQFLNNNPKSVAAMYVDGSILLERHSQEDNLNLLNLAEMFQSITKWNIVEFLCKKILSVSENRHALRILSGCYGKTGRTDEMYQVNERLIKADHDEVEMVKELAERSLKNGNSDKALAFYRVAFERTIAHHDVSTLRVLFDKMLALTKSEFETILANAEKVAAQSTPIGVAVLRDMENKYKDDVEKRILCEKKILSLDNGDELAKKNLVASYKLKYKDHSRLATCLSESTLSNNYTRDVMHAIEDFEKNISFDKGTFVYQESRRRLGRIRDISDLSVTIDFVHQTGNEGTTMSPAMAFKSLKALKKSNILVLKGCIDKKRLADKFMSDVKWGVDIMLTSFDGKCSLKQMKKELVNDVLSEGQWSTWYKEAREILMNGDHYDVSPDDDSYILRSSQVTFDDKQLSIFNSHKLFYDKVRDLKKYLASDSCNTDSESFYEMISYFSNILESRKVNLITDGEMMGSYLLLDDLLNRKKFTFIKIPTGVTFSTLVKSVADDKLPIIFSEIDDPDLKKCFISWEVETNKDWKELFLKLFPYYLTSYIPDIYKSKKQYPLFQTMYRKAVYEYRDYSNMFIYLIKNSNEKEWADAGVTKDLLIFKMIEMLGFLNKKVDAKIDGQESGANAKFLVETLFGVGKEKNGLVFKYLDEGNEDSARNIDSVVQSCFNLDPGEKINVRYTIQMKYPNMSFNDQKAPIDKDDIIPTGWFCTQSSLESKKAELEHVLHVELPEVAKDIGEAREKGDLRENSEYKYGKEHQEFLNTKAGNLKGEIDKAIVITKDKVDPSKSGFGTKVDLLDNNTGKEISYEILGPWESNPNNNVINILAPLGSALFNRTVGERFTFHLGETDYDYTVKNISVLDIK